ncbi:uncharacterized protein FYW61_016547 isoform 2-T2 [Anableps anableps]
MTVCLYKCLTAAGLQRHYARFTLMGVYRAAHLSALSMEDFPLLGVCAMDDRARLFQLIQLVKSLNLSRLTYDDIGIYNESDYEGVDELFLANNSFSPDGYGNPDGDVRRDKNESEAFTGISNASRYRSSNARRRLDFSAENRDQRLYSHFEDTIHVYASRNRNNDPVHENGSATPIKPGLHSRSAVVCDLRQSKNRKLNDRSCTCDPHNGQSIKLHITRGPSVLNSHIRLVPKSETANKLSSSSAAVKSKLLTNKPSAQKDRKTISWKKNCSADVTKPTPVCEAKRTAGYNYGLPLGSPQAANRHLESHRIRVCVRKRPLTHAECRRGEVDVVTTPNEGCVVVHENKEAVDLTEYILQRFHFDQVFGEDSSNAEVYQKTAYPLVQHMLSGGKATCFAYGQTGAGKTHTMLGSSPGGTGLYALAVQDIFAHLSATHTSLLVYVSFFEIYCGQLYDLLEHRKRLFAREDGKKVVHISGLQFIRVDSVSSLLEVISQGTAERTQGMSGVNPLSSRSHALLQIQLRDLNQQIAGRMWFVDLAGSERASDTKEPNKQSRMEGAEINQSLLALKECIRSLDKEESHTPFRQSKLTQVLKDSFVGDSMTCMIANISPGHSATEHTLNTLRYADRVKELRRQSGQIERRRRKSNMAHSEKKNMSGNSNNIRNRRNVETSKNPKLGNQNENFSPKPHTTRPHIWDTMCSTPIKTSCGEETQTRTRNGKDIELEHISPIRGWLVKSEGLEVRQDGRTENERYNNIHSHCVKGKHTRVAGMSGQQNKGVVKGSDLTFSDRESGFYHSEKENNQQTMKGRRREEPEWTEMRRQMETCRKIFREEEGLKERELHKPDDKEKVRHLREYHQQLQQFLPSPTSSSVHPLSSSTCPSFSSSTQGSLSSLLHSSHFSFPTHTHPCLEETSDVQTETSANNPKNVAGDDKCKSEGKVMAEETDKAAVRKEEKRPAGRKEGEMRYCWVGSTEMESQQIPTKTETHLSACLDSEDKRDVDLQRLQTRNIAWSLDQKGVSDYDSKSPPFDSPDLQATAERPLSPVCEDTSMMSVLPQDDVPQNSLGCIMDPLRISQLRVDQQAATASFLPGDNSNTTICPFKSEKDKRKETGKGCHCYVKKVEELVNHNKYAEFSLSPLEHARLCIIEAHSEQLKEMEAICHKEGELLCQQHDMAFVEFVNKLAEILERKAQCVHSMKAHLRAYLKTNHHSTQEDYENAIM